MLPNYSGVFVKHILLIPFSIQVALVHCELLAERDCLAQVSKLLLTSLYGSLAIVAEHRVGPFADFTKHSDRVSAKGVMHVQLRTVLDTPSIRIPH
jgi:hypothetical protein